MIYATLRRIFRRHAKFHLIIPLAVGIVFEAVYYCLASADRVTPSGLATHLFSSDRVVLYAGILFAYVFVISILIRSETSLGLLRIDLNTLVKMLKGAKSIYAIGTLTFEEWFDPAVQVYFATLLEPKLTTPSFQYNRVLLLPGRRAQRDLNSPFLDGYHARCLIDIHRLLGVNLYFLEWTAIRAILSKLNVTEKVHIALYPSVARHVPDRLARLLMWPFERRQTRHVACLMIEASNGSTVALRFTKRAKIVTLDFEPEPHCLKAYMKLIDLIKIKVTELGEEAVFAANFELST